MPTPLPARNIFDGTANPTTSQMKTALGSLRDYLAEMFGTAGGAPVGVTSINGGQLAGLRNKITNGAFSINQRGLSGTVTLSAGQYGHDFWKAGASGCTYTFTTVNGLTTITILAGSLVQVVRGTNLDSGTHVLSWIGTAQGKIGAGAYAASGIAGSVTGGANLAVEFGVGTLTKVQFEPGTIPTVFERIPNELTLALCKPRGQIVFGGFGGPSVAGGNGSGPIAYPVQPDGTPTVTWLGAVFTNNFPDSAPAIASITPYGFRALRTAVASGQDSSFMDTYFVEVNI